MRNQLMLALSAVACVVVGCGESSSDETKAASAGGSGAATAAWLVASAPEGAKGVAESKVSANEGDAIVLRGVIGGRVDPIGADMAVFVLMDTGLANPCLADDDHCATPWDYCCNTADEKIAFSATVQVVDGAGAPLTTDLSSHGIEPLDEIIVVGVVGPRPTSEVLVVRASKVHKVGG